MRLLFALFVVLALAACSSPPPTPPQAQGALTPANADAGALNELVRAAVAATNAKAPRFVATRDERLKEVLTRWSRQENVRLVYQTEFNPKLIGAVSEPDLRAAGVALSVLLQNEKEGAVLDFSNPKVIVVRNYEKEPAK